MGIAWQILFIKENYQDNVQNTNEIYILDAYFSMSFSQVV